MAIERVSVVIPLHHPQLGYKPSGPTDCAVRSAQTAIEFGTWGEESPEPKVLRPLMGADPTGGTSITQALKGVRSFGIAPLKIGTRNRGPVAKIREWLEAGHLVVVYGNYGAVIDGWRPLAGSKTYRGGHAIPIYGLQNGQTLSFDPLYDGRRDNIPDGPTLVPLGLVLAFTSSMKSTGPGRGMAYAVPLDALKVKAEADLAKASTELAETKAALVGVSQQLFAAQEQNEKLEKANADLQRQLDECRAEPPPEV